LLVDESFGNISVRSVCEKVGKSERQFNRKFNEIVGIPPLQYIKIRQLHFIINRIHRNHFESIKELAYDTGFYDPAHFNHSFKKLTGMSPGAFIKSDVDKAKEFIQAGMYHQAISLLEKEIADNPTNAEAHYQLGICYVDQGNSNRAEEKFSISVHLKPDYRFKIGRAYKKMADVALNRGKLSSIRSHYDKAINYNPSLRKDIASNLLKKGLQGGKNADVILSQAISYNRKLEKEVTNYYYALSQQTTGGKSLEILKKANNYSRKYDSEIGNKLLEIANRQESESSRKKYIEEASNYTDKKTLFHATVQYYTDRLGHPKKIELNTGEWVEAETVEYGDKIHYLSMYNFKTRKGGAVRLWKAAILEKNLFLFTDSDMIGNDISLWFSKNYKNTTVYFWTEKI